MESLSERLKALGVKVGTSEIQAARSKSPQPRSLIDVLPGSWETTPRGDCFTVRKSFPLSQNHGRFQIAPAPNLAIFDSIQQLEGISGIPAEDFLFIDTETTGLSGGAGTYVFLVGAAKYQGDKLDFAQFFLQDPGNESAQLAALEEYVTTAKVIISYNGKSFDLPRINTRYRFHGLQSPFADIYHLDLLHFARRLWKSHLPGCTLGDLEHHLLGLKREGHDIPGWKVAEYFMRYLSTSDPEPLTNIFYHNEIDVISLAALLSYLAERLSNPLQNEFLNHADLVSIGCYLFSLGFLEDSQDVLKTALANTSLPDRFRLEGNLCLAALHKKKRELPLAAPLWEDSAALGSLDAYIELAKYAEHTLRDFQDAIHWTLSALDNIDLIPRHKRETYIDQLDHRLARLKRKAMR